MLAIWLGIVLFSSIGQEPQEPPPVFRAEAVVVPVPLTVFKRTWYGRSTPLTNLDAADLEIIVEHNVYVPIRLDPDPHAPGRYLLSFTPPEHLRDGKPRQIHVRFKKRLLIPVTMSLPPPSVPDATGDRGSERGEAVN